MRVWILLVIAACGVDQHSSGPYVALDHIPEAFQQAQCAHLVACHEMPDLETCLGANIGTFQVDPTFVQEALAGKLRYNGSQLAQCFATLAASSCNSGDLANRKTVAQCGREVFGGTVVEGGTCTNDVECLSNVCGNCDGELACCPAGACVGEPASPVPPGLGTTCVIMHGIDPCVRGQYCDQTKATCQPLKAIGAPCLSTNECGDGLECDAQTTNRCAVPPLRDEPCTPTGYCGEEGTYCEPGDDICRSVGLVGDSCAAGHRCSSYLYCDLTSQQCRLYPRAGESCDVEQRCNDLNTYCDLATSKCIARIDLGQLCDASYRCLTDYCDMATLRCAEPPLCAP